MSGGRHSPTVAVLRDALVVAGVAVLTVQGLRRWYGDRYLVPSDSMQPVLYGDPERGDVVFVDKTASAAAMRRGDLVVVENPSLPGHQLVKRIAARGDDELCWIDLRKGDVWLGADEQSVAREVKPPRAALERAVPWAEAGDDGEAAAPLDLDATGGSALEAGPWSLPPAATSLVDQRGAYRPRAHRARHRDEGEGVLPTGAVGTRAPVDASFLDQERRRSETGRDVGVFDCTMALRFAAPWPEVVLATVETTDAAATTTFVWTPAKDYLEVWVAGRTVREQQAVLGRPWRGELVFGRLDGRDYLLLDDEHELALGAPGDALLPRTWLHVAVTGEVTAELTSLRVLRDVYAWRVKELGVGDPSWPRYVPPGHWFLLGDNAFDSRDSRSIGPVSTERFLGVPTCVIGPWSRARWLAR